MEHSALADPIIEAATENLTHTYLELGRSLLGSRIWRGDGFRSCTGHLDHPICNFAIDVRPRESDFEQLRQLAFRKNSFTVYVLPPHDDPRGLAAMADAGFSVSHKLSIMVSDSVISDRVELEEVEIGGRRKIAEFMADQFFHRQPTSFRRGIAEATASATSLRLIRAYWNKRTAGAAMISEHADVIGLYNLCIAPHFRSRGWGSAIVRTVVDDAAKGRRSVTLQCEPSLASWYSSLGFKEVGTVSVFGLYRFKEVDIIG
jgi:hypothetical protein